MQETEIISKLHQLKQIKPSSYWVVSLKKQIIGEQAKVSVIDVLQGVIFQRKLVYATISLVIMVFGVFGFAQYTVPGDLLFPMKKITEQSQGALLASVDQSNYNLDIVNKRLGELANIIKDNKTNSIAPAIQEVKEGMTQIAKNMPNNTDDFTNIATRVQKIQQTKTEVETLGVIMLQESNELNNSLAPLVENEIKVLDSLSKAESLTLAQEMRLVEVKSHYKKGEYTAALEKILLITNL